MFLVFFLLTPKQLRGLVPVVDPSEEMLAAADVRIEMGPGGGPSGGRILSVEKA